MLLDVPDDGQSPAESTLKPAKGPSGVWQVGLSTLLLATACAAVWFSTWINHRKIEKATMRLQTLQPLSRELVVSDPDRLAIIKQDEMSYDQQIWHLYVPNDSYQLKLATHEIGLSTSMRKPGASKAGSTAEPVAGSAKISAGRHVIELQTNPDGQEWVTRVTVDHEEVIAVKESKEWNESSGSSGGGNFARQTEVRSDQPAVLLERVFYMQTNAGTSMQVHPERYGVKLWLAPATE